MSRSLNPTSAVGRTCEGQGTGFGCYRKWRGCADPGGRCRRPGTIEAAKEAQAKGNTDLRVISWVKDKNYLASNLVIGGWKEDITRNMDMSLRR